MEKFPKKRVLITGGGSGLGQALALEFASNGWKIGVVDINQDRIKETQSLVAQKGGESLGFFCDVANFEDLTRTAAEIKSQWGGLDVLINNAGIGWGGLFTEINNGHWDKVMDVNLKGVFNGCRAFIPMMIQQGAGHIISTSSTRAIFPLPEMSLYNVSKAGVLSLSESLKIELAPKNIRISVILPNFFKSNILNQSIFTNEEERGKAEKLARLSKGTAQYIAKYTYKSLYKNRFYILPSWLGRMIARFKRYFPAVYLWLVSRGYKRGIGH